MSSSWLSTLGHRLNALWPYNLSPKTALKKALVLTAGIVAGAKCVTSYYRPLEVCDIELYLLLTSLKLKSLKQEIDTGKKELLIKYKKRFDEAKLADEIKRLNTQ